VTRCQYSAANWASSWHYETNGTKIFLAIEVLNKQQSFE